MAVVSKKRNARGQFENMGGRSFQPRLGETDKQTRGKDRLPTTILPARRTIVNVYMLLDKKSAMQGVPNVKGSAPRTAAGGGGPKKPQATYVVDGVPYKREIIENGIIIVNGVTYKSPNGYAYMMDLPESQVPIGQINGTDVNMFGFPVYDPSQYPYQDKESRRAYNQTVSTFMKNLHESKSKEKAKKPKYEKKEAGEEKSTLNEEMNKKEEFDKKRKSSAEQIIWNNFLDVNGKSVIPEETGTGSGKYSSDPRYRKYTAREPSEAEEIIKALRYVRSNKDMKLKVTGADIKAGKYAPIVAIRASGSRPPNDYYISNEVFPYMRRKKGSRPATKRGGFKITLPKLSYRSASKSSGKKRKVIIRRKGGKR